MPLTPKGAFPVAQAEPTGARGGALLVVEDTSRSFGSLTAVDGVSFSVQEGTITALIGPNGAGKTTLFNLICGYEPVDSGSVSFEGTRIETWQADQIARAGIGRTFQLVQIFEGMSVLENVMCGRTRFAQTSLASVIVRSPRLVAEERVSREKASAALELAGISAHADDDPTTLPFGLQRQLELARVLALEPRLLMMDEPASGLNDAETERLAELILRIRAAGTTVLLVEHDMRLVMGIADHLVVLDRGRKLIEGDPQSVRTAPEVVSAYLGGKAE